MKKVLIVIAILLPSVLFSQVSIYNIQYTTNAGNGTYPSLYQNQIVTTGGIVTATGFLGGRYFISSSQGGAWNSIFVYDDDYSPSIGDSVLITGRVYEYNGFTELKDLTSLEVISSSNSLPKATKISTNNVTDEAYESVLVEVNNCSVSSVYDGYGNFWLNDGSGVCEIRQGIFNLMNYGFPMVQNYSFNSIIGVIGLNYGSTSIQPRTIDDIKSSEEALILFTDDRDVIDNTNFELPIKIAILNQSELISSYSLKMQYDPTIFQYTGFNKTGTISETGTIIDASTEGNITLNYSGSFNCNDLLVLLKLKFKPILTGNANLQFNAAIINGNEIIYYSAGKLENSFVECDIPIGDTLTIVQRPLLNIPTILTPGQELVIECFAPETTSSWNAELFYNDISVALDISQSNYNADLQKWTLKALIPELDVYELYDLRVTAAGGISDDVTNAVKITDHFKDNFYFIQFTDTHLPTHIFYGETGSATDTSELNDLYEVIKDINLIRPEFVLFTGDFVNEGEMEDFECRRNHTRSIAMLEKIEVPVFMVPGNHDLGGWDATPPPQGTARKEWWRFFGWRQREIPPVKEEYYTHDYSFDYSNVHFVGLEAYDNYDSYMFEVYGTESFILSQITWLKNDLQNAVNKTKVLFYHYDFKHELNLSSLGVDMALWGHIHKDEGDINIHPYNLSTDNVCDGDRAYRIIRVNNGILKPENSIHTHSNTNEDMISINYNMINNGSLDSVSATINNKNTQAFNNGLVKFEMPLSDFSYSVTNGNLEQIIVSGSIAECHVNVNIPSNGKITVSIKKNTSNITQINNLRQKSLFQNFPNPFSDDTNIKIGLNQNAKVKLSIYDISGQLVKVLVDENKIPGEYSYTWDGTNTNGSIVKNGIYLYKYIVNGELINSKQMIFAK